MDGGNVPDVCAGQTRRDVSRRLRAKKRSADCLQAKRIANDQGSSSSFRVLAAVSNSGILVFVESHRRIERELVVSGYFLQLQPDLCRLETPLERALLAFFADR